MQLYRLLARCTTPHTDGRIQGFRALAGTSVRTRGYVPYPAHATGRPRPSGVARRERWRNCSRGMRCWPSSCKGKSSYARSTLRRARRTARPASDEPGISQPLSRVESDGRALFLQSGSSGNPQPGCSHPSPRGKPDICAGSASLRRAAHTATSSSTGSEVTFAGHTSVRSGRVRRTQTGYPLAHPDGGSHWTGPGYRTRARVATRCPRYLYASGARLAPRAGHGNNRHDVIRTV
ncbi:MAG: hypothetical protein CBHOC_3274 [uncultured Caballeronia sp.]|nr:MAG: hypothetical protein CBHOC_3274 [uncultured Caballeronia sp.]